MPSHDSFYRDNEAYAELLAQTDPTFYAKYADALQPDRPGGRILDVGCGVGQALARLRQAGWDAYGIEVSNPNVAKARQVSRQVYPYDGREIPFPDDWFASCGAFNVLEHVEEPENLIAEMVRVTEPGGHIVLSSPNFFRVIGFRDYHPRMRGIRNKARNARRLLQKLREMRAHPDRVRFDSIQPIVREPFQPDDDAIVATNPIELRFFLEKHGCEVIQSVCTDRYVPGWIDRILNLTPCRFLMFNAFVVARKCS